MTPRLTTPLLVVILPYQQGRIRRTSDHQTISCLSPIRLCNQAYTRKIRGKAYCVLDAIHPAALLLNSHCLPPTFHAPTNSTLVPYHPLLVRVPQASEHPRRNACNPRHPYLCSRQPGANILGKEMINMDEWLMILCRIKIKRILRGLNGLGRSLRFTSEIN